MTGVASVDAERFMEALEAMHEVFARAANAGVTAQDLEIAKAIQREDLRRRMHTPQGLAELLAADFLLGKAPGDWIERVKKELDGITTTDLEQLASRYLDRRRARVVAVGDYSYIATGLAFEDVAVEYGDIGDVYAN